MDRGAWQARAHGVAKRQTWLSNWAWMHARWAQHNQNDSQKWKGRPRVKSQRRCDEGSKRVIRPEDSACHCWFWGWMKGPWVKERGGLKQLEKARKDILLKSLQKGTQPCLEFSPVRTVSDFICVASTYSVCGNLLQHSQETNHYMISQCPVVCGGRPARCIVGKQPSDWLMLHAEGWLMASGMSWGKGHCDSPAVEPQTAGLYGTKAQVLIVAEVKTDIIQAEVSTQMLSFVHRIFFFNVKWFPTFKDSLAGRGTPSRAREWALV